MKPSVLIFCLCFSASVCSAQKLNKLVNSAVSNKEFIDTAKSLRSSNIVLKETIDSIGAYSLALRLSHDSLAKLVSDTRLRESLKSAESTINMQNSWLTGFGAIYSVITVVFGILSIILSLQARDAIKRAEDATERLIDKTDDFEEKLRTKLNDRFKEYEKELLEKELDEMFKDLRNAKHTNQRRLQIERLSSRNVSSFSSERIFDLCEILNLNLTEEEKMLLLEILIETKNKVVIDFIKRWNNVHTDEDKLKSILYAYYMDNGFIEFQGPVTSFIQNKATQYQEFQKVLAMLPSHPNYFYSLLNNKVLIRSLDSSTVQIMRNHVLTNLATWASTIQKDIVEGTELFKVNV